MTTEDINIENLVAEALEHAQYERWPSAIGALERALKSAPMEYLSVMTETLAVFYTQGKQYAKLAELLLAQTEMSPAFLLGHLLLERNRRLGIGEPFVSRTPWPKLLQTLQAYVAEGRYTVLEMWTVCSLLVQIGEAKMGLVVMNLLVDWLYQTQLVSDNDEEHVTAMLALALDKGLKQQAEALIDRLAGLAPYWQVRAVRWKALIRKTLPQTDSQDKVALFLAAPRKGNLVRPA